MSLRKKSDKKFCSYKSNRISRIIIPIKVMTAQTLTAFLAYFFGRISSKNGVSSPTFLWMYPKGQLPLFR